MGSAGTPVAGPLADIVGEGKSDDGGGEPPVGRVLGATPPDGACAHGTTRAAIRSASQVLLPSITSCDASLATKVPGRRYGVP